MLLQAVKDGKSKLVKILLEGGREANQETPDGKGPLSLAITSSYDVHTKDKILRLLLQHGADVNKKDQTRRTPLILAVLSDQTSVYIISVLLENGANLSIKDTYGLNAVGYARKLNNFQVFDFLQDHMLAEGYKSDRLENAKKYPISIRKPGNNRPVDQLFHDMFKDDSEELEYNEHLEIPRPRLRCRSNPVSNDRCQNIPRPNEMRIPIESKFKQFQKKIKMAIFHRCDPETISSKYLSNDNTLEHGSFKYDSPFEIETHRNFDFRKESNIDEIKQISPQKSDSEYKCTSYPNNNHSGENSFLEECIPLEVKPHTKLDTLQERHTGRKMKTVRPQERDQESIYTPCSLIDRGQQNIPGNESITDVNSHSKPIIPKERNTGPFRKMKTYSEISKPIIPKERNTGPFRKMKTYSESSDEGSKCTLLLGNNITNQNLIENDFNLESESSSKLNITEKRNPDRFRRREKAMYPQESDQESIYRQNSHHSQRQQNNPGNYSMFDEASQFNVRIPEERNGGRFGRRVTLGPENIDLKSTCTQFSRDSTTHQNFIENDSLLEFESSKKFDTEKRNFGRLRRRVKVVCPQESDQECLCTRYCHRYSDTQSRQTLLGKDSIFEVEAQCQVNAPKETNTGRFKRMKQLYLQESDQDEEKNAESICSPYSHSNQRTGYGGNDVMFDYDFDAIENTPKESDARKIKDNKSHLS